MKPELEKQKVAKLSKRSRIPTIETYEEEEASDSDPDYEEPIAKKKKSNSSGKEGGSSDQVKNLISNWKHTTRKRPNDISDIPYCFSSVYLGRYVMFFNSPFYCKKKHFKFIYFIENHVFSAGEFV